MATRSTSDFASEAVLRDWVRPGIAEFVGTFTLIFAGAGAIIVTEGRDLVAIALAHGLAIGLMVAAAGHVSGGVYNPAVAVGLMIGRRLTPAKTAFYVAVELLGAAVAALSLYLLFPHAAREAAGIHLGTPALAPAISTGRGVGLELVMTFFLMFVIYGVAIDARGPHAIAGLAIGLTITMDIFAGGPATGAAMNPARAFGPALIDNFWTDHWVYWVGPIIGAAIAALVYNYVLIPQEEQPPTG